MDIIYFTQSNPKPATPLSSPPIFCSRCRLLRASYRHLLRSRWRRLLRSRCHLMRSPHRLLPPTETTASSTRSGQFTEKEANQICFK
ncbi:uncharacterized protein DS421_13g432890 [Arachis hypogaea]|nr:uncharacterized protein DS421_13g432890 [Arachis hypogaea]